MAITSKSQGPHLRIIVGLPDIQDQIRMVNQLSSTAGEPELGRWENLGNLLCELYAQLQHQKQVTIYRCSSKSASSSAASSRGPKTRRRR